MRYRRVFALIALPYVVLLWIVLGFVGVENPIPWLMAFGYGGCYSLALLLPKPKPVRHCQNPDCYMCERRR